MSARKTVHYRNIGHTVTACGLTAVRVSSTGKRTTMDKSRVTWTKNKVTCNRCRSNLGIAHTWAQQHGRGVRKPAKETLDNRRFLNVAPSAGDYTPEQVRKALGPNADIVLNDMAVKMIRRRISVPQAVPNADYMARLEAVYSFASEFCDAVAEAEQLDGKPPLYIVAMERSRSTDAIITDLSVAVGYVDQFKRDAVKHENET